MTELTTSLSVAAERQSDPDDHQQSPTSPPVLPVPTVPPVTSVPPEYALSPVPPISSASPLSSVTPLPAVSPHPPVPQLPPVSPLPLVTPGSPVYPPPPITPVPPAFPFPSVLPVPQVTPLPPVSPLPLVLPLPPVSPPAPVSPLSPFPQLPPISPLLLVPEATVPPQSPVPPLPPVPQFPPVSSLPQVTPGSPEAPVPPLPPVSQFPAVSSPPQVTPGSPEAPVPPLPPVPQFPPASSLPLVTPGSPQPPLPPESARPVYNPIEHRDVEHPNSVLGSIINLLKASLGTGILAMPSAFKNAGLVIGTLGIVFAGTVVTHSIHVMVRTAQEVCVVAEVPSMGFAETCGAAFTYGPKKLQPLGPFIQRFADGSLILCYAGVLCIYVVFIVESIKEVFDSISPNFKLSSEIYCGIILIPLVLICQIRSLKYVVPFSAIANVGIFVVFAITLKFILTDFPSPSVRKLVAPFATWPLFISIAVFAIEGIGVVFPVENEMARPEMFLGCPGVLNITMSIVIFLYGAVGFLGYVKYGDDVKGSITLNLPETGFFANCTKLLMAVVIFLTYTLQFYVPMEGISRRLSIKKDTGRYHDLIQISIRTFIVSLSVLVAALVPNLELVISLVGAIFFSTCGILLPPIVETVYRWDRNLGRYNYIIWKNVAVIGFGVITLISGSITSLKSMEAEKAEDYDEFYDEAKL